MTNPGGHFTYDYIAGHIRKDWAALAAAGPRYTRNSWPKLLFTTKKKTPTEFILANPFGTPTHKATRQLSLTSTTRMKLIQQRKRQKNPRYSLKQDASKQMIKGKGNKVQGIRNRFKKSLVGRKDTYKRPIRQRPQLSPKADTGPFSVSR